MNTYQKIFRIILCTCMFSSVYTAPKKPQKPPQPVEQELKEVDPTITMINKTKERLETCKQKFTDISRAPTIAQKADFIKEVIDILCKDVPSDIITRIKNAEFSEQVVSLRDTIEQLRNDLAANTKKRDAEKAKAEKEKFKAIDDAIKINFEQSSTAIELALAQLYKIAHDFSQTLELSAQKENIKKQENPNEITKFYQKIKSEVPSSANQFRLEGDTKISLAVENLWVLVATMNVITIFERVIAQDTIAPIVTQLMQQINAVSALEWPALPDDTKTGLVLRGSIVRYIASVTALAQEIKTIEENFTKTNQAIQALKIGA